MSRDPICVIDPATLSDIPELLAIEGAAFVPADGMLSRRAMRRHIGSRHLFLVARSPARLPSVQGYILVFVYRKSARIYSLAVGPEFRGQGIARALVRAALERIASLGLVRVNLEVRESNVTAQGLYESLGFRKIGLRERYYGDGEDALRMQLIMR